YVQSSLATATVNEPHEAGYGKNMVGVDHMKDYMEANHVDEILLSLPVKKSKKIRKILAIADYHGTRVKIVPDYHFLIDSPRRGGYKPIIMDVRPMPLDNWKLSFLKELF